MRYIVCEKPGLLVLKDNKNPPDKVPGEALLQVLKVGICGTDLHAYEGTQPFFTYPRILGHELAVEVLEIDPNPQDLKTGDRVVVMPYKGCKRCYACRSGKSNCCENIQVLGVHTDGGMQEIISLPTDLLIPAPGLDTNQISVVEPLAIGAHALRRAQLQAGEKVVVAGCGPIGLGLMVQAKLKGALVIAVDTNTARLERAKNYFGADFIIQADQWATEAVKKITEGEMAAVVIDATGNRKALETGYRYMAHGGRYVLVGLSKEVLSFRHPELHARETSLLCSRNATHEDFEEVIGLLRQEKFPLHAYISQEVPLSELATSFDQWLKPENEIIKTIVTI